jgi:hypothetical protein
LVLFESRNTFDAAVPAALPVFSFLAILTYLHGFGIVTPDASGVIEIEGPHLAGAEALLESVIDVPTLARPGAECPVPPAPPHSMVPKVPHRMGVAGETCPARIYVSAAGGLPPAPNSAKGPGHRFTRSIPLETRTDHTNSKTRPGS